MKVSDLRQSRFLSKGDCDNAPHGAILATIHHVDQETLENQQGQNEIKWILHFEEELDETSPVKPLVMNVTHGEQLQDITGSDDSDDWTGWKVVLFNDKSVSYAGRRTGGVRIRAPKGAQKPPEKRTAPPPAPTVTPPPDDDFDDDDIPF